MTARHIGQPLCETHEWAERRDPDYDDPRPLEWRELLNLRIWIGGLIVLAGFIAFCILIFTLVPAPVPAQ